MVQLVFFSGSEQAYAVGCLATKMSSLHAKLVQ